MRKIAKFSSHVLTVLVIGALVAACASNGEAKAPDPGSKKWYAARMAELDQAKADGKLTEEEYLKLKTETDETRQEYVNARNDSTSGTVDLGFGAGFGTGRTHGGPGAQRPSGGGGSKPH